MQRFLHRTLEAWRTRRAAAVVAARPRTQRELRLDRSTLGAAVEARLAVRAGVRLEDFLRYRLARYAARLPVPLEALPVTIDVEAGDTVVRARPAARGSSAGGSLLGGAAPGARGGDEARVLAALAAREGPAAVREVRDLAARVDALASRAAEARVRADELSRGLSDDLASGALPAHDGVDAEPEQLGRPPVPHLAPALALRALALAMLGAEAWRLAGPVFAASGLESYDVAGTLSRAPLAAGLALVFAVGAAASIFAFLAVAVQRAVELAEGPARRRLLAWACAGGAGLAAAVAIAAGVPGRLTEAVLLATVPLAGVLLLRRAAALSGERGSALTGALAWDQARAREVVARARRAEAVTAAQDVVATLEAERELATRRLRALERRACDDTLRAEEAAREESRRLERLAEALAAALELDRYAFLVRASEQTHDLLARPARPARPRIEAAVGTTERLGVAG